MSHATSWSHESQGQKTITARDLKPLNLLSLIVPFCNELTMVNLKKNGGKHNEMIPQNLNDPADCSFLS